MTLRLGKRSVQADAAWHRLQVGRSQGLSVRGSSLQDKPEGLVND